MVFIPLKTPLRYAGSACFLLFHKLFRHPWPSVMSPRIFRWSWMIVWTELLMLRWSASFLMEIRLTNDHYHLLPWAALLSVAMIVGLPARGKSRTLALPSLKSRFHSRTAESLMAWLPYTLRIHSWILETDSPCIEKIVSPSVSSLGWTMSFWCDRCSMKWGAILLTIHFSKKMQYDLKTNVRWSAGYKFYYEEN